MNKIVASSLVCMLMSGTAIGQTSPNAQGQQQDQQTGQQQTTQDPQSQPSGQAPVRQPVQVQTRVAPTTVASVRSTTTVVPVRPATTVAPMRPATTIAPPTKQTITIPVDVRRNVAPVPSMVRDLTAPETHQNYLSRYYGGSDSDGDGHRAVQHRHERLGLGTDCDDGNPNRFPGNPEVADFDGNDEDCDPSTIGEMDQDGDGFTDWRVWNAPFTRVGRPVYGEDCDDTRRGVNPGIPEIPGNGLDDNCDGDVDFDRSWPTE